MRLKNFIMFGKGRGLRLFFWAGFIFSFLTSLFLYFQLTTFFKLPEVNQFIHKIPIITVTDGQITDPQKTFVQEPIPFLNRGLFVLNTLDSPDYTLNFDNGVYVTKTMLHVKNFDMINSVQLKDFFGKGTTIISPNMILEQITLDTLIFVAIWFVLCFFLSWAVWGIVYLFSWLILGIFDRFVCACVRARAVSVILPILLFVCWVFSPLVSVNLLTFLLLGTIFVVIVLWQMPTHSQMMEKNLTLLQEENETPKAVVVKEEKKPVQKQRKSAPVQKKKAPAKSVAKKAKTTGKTQKAKAGTTQKTTVKTARKGVDKKAKRKAGGLKK